MAASQKAQPVQDPGDGCFGLLANGASGLWAVAVDVTTSGPERWFAQVEGPSVALYFEIPSVDIVSEALQVLAPRRGAKERSSPGTGLVLTKDDQMPITLLADDEYPDRFFIMVGAPEKPVVRFSFSGTDAVQLAEALRQVGEDLEDEG
jgi:hypothetical protein